MPLDEGVAERMLEHEDFPKSYNTFEVKYHVADLYSRLKKKGINLFSLLGQGKVISQEDIDSIISVSSIRHLNSLMKHFHRKSVVVGYNTTELVSEAFTAAVNGTECDWCKYVVVSNSSSKLVSKSIAKSDYLPWQNG